MSKSNFKIRVSRDFIEARVAYSIRNVETRVKVIAKGKGDEVTLKFYALPEPRIDSIYPPTYGEPYREYKFSLSGDKGIAEAVTRMVAALDEPTPYSEDTIERISFRISPIFDKFIYQGGRIVDYYHDNISGRTTVQIESSNKIRMGIAFTKPINGKRAHESMKGSYLIIDELDNTVVLSDDTVKKYYREILIDRN